jgi:hypothetical protein
VTRDQKTDSDPEVGRSLQRLGRAVVPVEQAERAAARRARMVPELATFADREFARRRSRVVLTRAGAAFGLVAAAALILVIARSNREPSLDAEPSASVIATRGDVQVERAGQGPRGAASSSMPLSTSDQIRTEDGAAQVKLRTGAAVELGPRTELQLGEAEPRGAGVDERVSLSAGRILVRVPKLGPGRLVVGTPHAEITVHGTVFEVTVQATSASEPPCTTVSVTEGRVSVASNGREIFLTPGASWSSARAAEATPLTGVAIDAGAAAARREGNGDGESRIKRSTLRAENELYKAALAARRAGNTKRTIELVDELLRRYPGTPLENAARDERARAEDIGRGKSQKP